MNYEKYFYLTDIQQSIKSRQSATLLNTIQSEVVCAEADVY